MCSFSSSLDGFVNPCRGIGGSHRKLLDGAGGKLATVATSPADSEESSLGVPEVAPPSSQHRNSITPPSVHAFVLILFFSHFSCLVSLSLSLSLFFLVSVSFSLLCSFDVVRGYVDANDVNSELEFTLLHFARRGCQPLKCYFMQLISVTG